VSGQPRTQRADGPGLTSGDAAATQPVLGAGDVPVLVLAVLTSAILVVLARSLVFWDDEWRFVAFSGSGLDYLRPLNDHWVTLPLALYRATFAVVGLQSYLPYLAELVALHSAAALGAYMLMRPRVGRVVATMLTAPLLLAGAGAENVFAAFQTTFVGSVVFGLWALVALESRARDRVAVTVAAVLLVASLACSGVGLVLVGLAILRCSIDPVRRRRALAGVPPVAVFVTWYALAGGGGESPLAGLAEIVRFTARGVGHAVASVTGIGDLPSGGAWGLALFAVALVASAVAWLKGRPLALGLSCLIVLPVYYAFVGALRGGHIEFADLSRYAYLAFFLLVLTASDWLELVRARLSSKAAIALVAAATLGLIVVGAREAVFARDLFRWRADVTHEIVQSARTESQRYDPALRFGVMPTMPELRDLVREYGWPSSAALAAGFPSLVLRAASELRVERAGHERAVLPFNSADARGVDVSREGECGRVTVSGSRGELTVPVAAGARLRLDPFTSGPGSVALSGLDRLLSVTVDLAAGVASDVVTPRLDGVRAWPVLLSLDGTADVRVCVLE
jgi:hypothetical protein